MASLALRTDLRESNEFDGLARAVREWEPLLDAILPPADARLFEPDGVLYGVCLSDGTTLSFNNHDRVLRKGDLVVVPRGLAFDVEPRVDLFAIRYDGPLPDHFRERFLQVWGCEHLPAPNAGAADVASAVAEIIPTSDLRHRVFYAVVDVTDAETDAEETGGSLLVFVGLEGNVVARVMTEGDEAADFPVPPGGALTVGPGTRYAFAGVGRLGRLTLSTEEVYRARRERARLSGGLPGPEFESPPPGSRGSADIDPKYLSCTDSGSA